MGKGKYYILAAALLGIALVAAACGPKPDTTPPPGDKEQTTNQQPPEKTEPPEAQPPENAGNDKSAELPGDPDAGKAVYAEKCGACHGANGEGVVGPAFVAKDGQPAVAERLSVEEHIKVVTDGRNTMPPWKDQLSEQQIKDVVSYERTMQ